MIEPVFIPSFVKGFTTCPYLTIVLEIIITLANKMQTNCSGDFSCGLVGIHGVKKYKKTVDTVVRIIKALLESLCASKACSHER